MTVLLILLSTGLGPLAAAAVLAAAPRPARAVVVWAAAVVADRIDRVRCLLTAHAGRRAEAIADAVHVVLLETLNEWDGPGRLYARAHHEHLVAAL